MREKCYKNLRYYAEMIAHLYYLNNHFRAFLSPSLSLCVLPTVMTVLIIASQTWSQRPAGKFLKIFCNYCLLLPWLYNLVGC